MSVVTVEGRIVNHKREFRGRIVINESSGLIEKIGSPTGEADIMVPEGSIIFPGFGDVHVHAREDVGGTQAHKEDFRTASEAAIHGGVTYFAEMPNNPIAPVDDARYRAKQKLTKKSLVDVTLYAGIGPNTKPLSFPVPYKAFMGPSVGDLFFTSQEELETVIRNYEECSISFHCEDPQILEQHKGEATHEAQRPPEAEILAVDFALTLIERYKLKGKLCHLSTPASIRKVKEAKRRGLSVTCEITPHHLYFDTSMITPENNSYLQVNPALRRSKEDRLELLRMLKDGDIDYLATDHAPHTEEEKQKGTSGMPHLDTFTPFVAWLMKEAVISPARIAEVCSFNPGFFVNPFRQVSDGRGFGMVEEGYVGSLTILNPARSVKIERENLKTKCGWSPFEGVTFPGNALYTIVRGKVYTNS